MLVVLATMMVTSVMMVVLMIALTYLATCQFTETWRLHLQELWPTPFVLLFLRISVFNLSICILSYSYFSAISFEFMGILLTLEISHHVSVLLNVWQLNNLDLCQNLIFISKVSPVWLREHSPLGPLCLWQCLSHNCQTPIQYSCAHSRHKYQLKMQKTFHDVPRYVE